MKDNDKRVSIQTLQSDVTVNSQIQFDDDYLEEIESKQLESANDNDPLQDENVASEGYTLTDNNPQIYKKTQTHNYVLNDNISLPDIEKRLWHQTLWEPVSDMEKSALSGSGQGYKVAAYCRVSCDVVNQVKSLKNQIRHYTYKIRENPSWKFVGIYFDAYKSGTTLKYRPSLQRLIRHAREGRVDLILTKNVSRISRNSKELLELVDELKKYGVGICFEAEGIDTSKDYNRFLLNTYVALAQGEVEETSNSVKWSYEKRLMNGKPLFQPLLGYDVEYVENDITNSSEILQNTKGITFGNQAAHKNKTLKVIESEAVAVRWIFEWYLNGVTLVEIARKLMSEGIKTKSGSNLWRGNTVKNILMNPTYTGNRVARNVQVDMFTRKASKNTVDKVLIENSHPAIIPMEIFQTVQEQFKLRKGPEKKNVLHKISSLSGRMICGRCGYNLTCYPTRGVNYWKCQPSDMKACTFSSLKEKNISKMMLKALVENYKLKDKKIDSDSSFLRRLKKLLEWINQNDHFEFYRLKYITEIEMAEMILNELPLVDFGEKYELRQRFVNENQNFISGQTFDGQNILNDMKSAYQDFEKKAAEIEDDRKWRDGALEYLNNVISLENFLETANVDILRAWIRSMIVYSEDDYIVTFVDDSILEIGNCDTYDQARFEDCRIETKFQNQLQIQTEPLGNKMHFEIQPQLIEIGKEENTLMKSNFMNVIKIEPGNSQFLVNDINRRIHGYETKGNYTALSTEKKLRVAAYCRVSTDREEQEVSLKTQIAYYTYRILKNPKYEFAGIFADDGISGKAMENRPEFLRLIEECRAGNVDLILTKSISRFSRNLVDCLSVAQELKGLPNPVYVEFEKENLSTKDEKSDFLISLFAGISQEESVNLGESIAWGKRRYAERGIVNPSRECYGYKHGPKEKWIINEDEAVAIKRIYREFLEGKSYTKIASGLIEDNVLNKSGNARWHISGIKSILTNPVYVGDVLYQKKFVKDSLTSKQVHNNGELPQYLVENNHPAIINRDEWESVQQKVKKKLETYKNGRVSYSKAEEEKIFLKKFTCSQCGSPIIALRSFKRHTDEYEVISWICNNRISPYSTQKCESGSFRQKYIELNFMKVLLDIRRSDELSLNVEAYRNGLKISTEDLKRENDIVAKMKKLNEELYEAVGEEARRRGQDIQLIDKLTENILVCKEQLREYQNRRDQIKQLEDELKWLNEQLVFLDENDINDLKYMDVRTSYPIRKDIFSRLVISGEIDKDGRVVYNLTLGVKWSIELTYNSFKNMGYIYRKQKNEQEKKKFLEGQEVKNLIKFCKEPKSFSEVFIFFNEFMSISEYHFRCTILYPLLELGKIKKLRPEERYKKGPQYYSGKRPAE